MKNLNKKGFTLIELLAVIVILAIVLVVTIPTVLTSMDTAREDTFIASASAVAEWFEKQEASSLLGSTSDAYSTFVSGKEISGPNFVLLDAAVVSAAGINATDYDVTKSCVKISNGRACVVLKPTSTGKFKQLLTDNADYVARSNACAGTETCPTGE